MKDTLRCLFVETLDEISLDQVMADKIRVAEGDLSVAGESYSTGDARRIFVAAIGKAAPPMAASLAKGLPTSKTTGVIVTSVAEVDPPPGFETFAGGHPYPNEQSREAAELLLERVSALGNEDLLICLLSGGGSAICETPIEPEISLEDVRSFYEVLVTCGANIVNMNILRKHLSRIKGGRLAEAAYPARQLTLYVSDVPPDQPSTVASGPTMPDESSAGLAYETAERLGIVERFPDPIREMFSRRALRETPKPGDAAFGRSSWHCLLDNFDALEVAEAKARAAGWVLERDLSVDDRPLDLAADVMLNRLRALAAANPDRTVAVTTGGELSSPVTGDGLGGRNQAFVLRVARKLAEQGLEATVISAGTDGIDGNSPAAGAVADHTSIARAAALGLDAADFEERSDSFNFFDRLGDALITGPTGNNVRDLRMLVASPGR